MLGIQNWDQEALQKSSKLMQIKTILGKKTLIQNPKQTEPLKDALICSMFLHKVEYFWERQSNWKKSHLVLTSTV